MRMLEFKFFIIVMLFVISDCSVLAQTKSVWKMQPIPIQTRWAKDVSPKNVLPEYPRPQLKRNTYWLNLNGLWDYAITDTILSGPINYQAKILVPFPIESALSGVQKQLLPHQNLYYRRNFTSPQLKSGERLLLNFGAVDWNATVFVNDHEVGKHIGGYTSFSFDVTEFLIDGENQIEVKVFDPTDIGINPHGKQTLNPADIYYTANSGIWQTVWLEVVPAAYITDLKFTPDIDKEELDLRVNLSTVIAEQAGISIEAIVFSDGKEIHKQLHDDGKDNSFALKVPNTRLWSPDDPFLYHLTVRLKYKGKVLDEVKSYFGMRKVNIQVDYKGIERIFLNNKPYFNLGVLDQGYWPEGLYTAPTDNALKFDIEAIKAMGFNTIRKHLKIEPARWYYHADKIGILVWQDFINPPHSLLEGSKAEFESETKEIISQLGHFPSIITWVLFNERWGAYDQKRLTKWIKDLEPSRILNGHSGELLYVNDKLRTPSSEPYIGSELSDVHSYPNPRLALKLLGKAMVCGEFGGIGVSVPGHEWNDLNGWGYIQVYAKDFELKYSQLIDSLKLLQFHGLSASIYTGPFDVEGEENGFMTYDRKIIKIKLKRLRQLNRIIVPSNGSSSTHIPTVKVDNIDVNDNDSLFNYFLKNYEQGKRDSVLLRRLSLMALRRKDQNVLTLVGNSYINQLLQIYSYDNLKFISFITKTSKDSGFSIFMNNADKINRIIGNNQSENIVRSIIGKEEVQKFINSNAKPDWNQFANTLKNKYGELGAEEAFGRAMLYYFKKEEWDSFGKYYSLYYRTAYSRSQYHINNMTWRIVVNIHNIETLNIAESTLRLSLSNGDQDNYQAYDTYANLLYKIGRKEEAIIWQRKAVKMAPEDNSMLDNLNKMLIGAPIW